MNYSMSFVNVMRVDGGWIQVTTTVVFLDDMSGPPPPQAATAERIAAPRSLEPGGAR